MSILCPYVSEFTQLRWQPVMRQQLVDFTRRCVVTRCEPVLAVKNPQPNLVLRPIVVYGYGPVIQIARQC